MMRSAFTLILAALSAAIPLGETRAQSSCPPPAITLMPAEQWDAARGGHPRVGTILKGAELLAPSTGDTCTSAPLDQLRHTVKAHLDDGGIVLLGEVHDNGAQHALRAALLKSIIESTNGRRPALVFEHIRTDQAAALATRPEATSAGAHDLLERLDWKNSGWPAAERFLPIFEVAVMHALAILPGHPARADVRDVARRGIEALSADTASRLGLGVPLPDALQSSLLDELEASHCGLMPRTAFTNMALAQRYRDAHMAATLVDAAKAHGSAVLFAGNGHVRSDRGVPWDLQRMASGRKVLTVMLIEVSHGRTDAAAYVERDPEGKPAADFTILTPRVDRADPCETMRARFKRK